MVERAHGFEEHTSEVKMRLFAPTLPALFEEAVVALSEVMAESPPQAPSADEPVRLMARDREALLAEWLNELIYRADSEGRLFTAAEIESLSDTELHGRVGGAAVSEWKTQVKAATLHELTIAPLAQEGWTASVVLDV
jgi:SHS2 domain-containing protein